MTTKWIYAQPQKLADDFTEYVQDDIFAEILVSRGVNTVDKAKKFLNPQEFYEEISPYAFSDMTKVVERVCKAIATDEKIVIFGDFDADGVTSTSLLYKALKYLGAKVEFYIPSRLEEGHGLNSTALIKLKSKVKMGLVITVDCGISNLKEVSLVKGFGVDVIITDHHNAGEDLPDAFAILNPKSPNSLRDNLNASQVESLNYLAGVGVAYKLAQALLEKYNKVEFQNVLLPLVAIGTVADVVPLLEENRLLVKQGIECIRELQPAGIKALVDVAGQDIENFDAQSIAFAIAPRVNAIGRLEHPEQVVELFTTDNMQRIEVISKYMNDCNKIRQGFCDNIFEEAVEKIEKDCDLKKNKAIILSDNAWHIGIIGIVASKICEKYYRPVIIMRIDEENQKLRCSARSIKGLNLYDTFCEVQEYLEVFGGHALAAGFSADEKNLKNIVDGLHQVVNENLEDEFLVPRINVDKNLCVKDLSVNFVKKLQCLEPCGEKNPAPLFSLEKLVLKGLRTIGANSNHLKLSFDENLEGVFWGRNCIDAEVGDEVDIVFSPQLNTFRDKTNVQLMLQDYKCENSSTKKCATKIVDHRKKHNAFDLLLNYLKVTKTQISIFAEHKETLELLSGKNLQGANIINRLNTQKTDQMVFLDLPPDVDVFNGVLQNAEPKVVHLIGQKNRVVAPDEVLKTLCGMLKYADSKLSGEVGLDVLASKLYLSADATTTCLNLLNQAQVIEIVDKNKENLKFKFLQSKDMSYIQSFDEYNNFKENLVSAREFDII